MDASATNTTTSPVPFNADAFLLASSLATGGGMSPVDAISLNYVFTVLGLLFQLCTIAYAVRHGLKRRTTFNAVLIASLVLYATSFIPLLLTSKLAVLLDLLPPALLRSGDPGIRASIVKREVLVRVYTALFSVATLIYLLLVQIRFRVIKALRPYHSAVDGIFVGVTILLWFCTTFYFGVLTSSPVLPSATATLVWTLYALLVDNILSFLFLFQLYKFRARMSAQTSADEEKGAGGDAGSTTATLGASKRALWLRVVLGLVSLCVMTWIFFILIFISTVVFARDPIMRTLMFRLGYAFTPLQFAGALVFMYSIRSLFADQEAVKGTANPAAGKTAGSRDVDAPPQGSATPPPAYLPKSSFPLEREPFWKAPFQSITLASASPKRAPAVLGAARSPPTSRAPGRLSLLDRMPRSTSLAYFWGEGEQPQPQPQAVQARRPGLAGVSSGRDEADVREEEQDQAEDAPPLTATLFPPTTKVLSLSDWRLDGVTSPPVSSEVQTPAPGPVLATPGPLGPPTLPYHATSPDPLPLSTDLPEPERWSPTPTPSLSSPSHPLHDILFEPGDVSYSPRATLHAIPLGKVSASLHVARPADSPILRTAYPVPVERGPPAQVAELAPMSP